MNNKLLRDIKDLDTIKAAALKESDSESIRISVGMSTCGISSGARKVFETIKEEVKKTEVNANVVRTGCIGMCRKEPIVEVLRRGYPKLYYEGVDTLKAEKLVKSLKEGRFEIKDIFAKLDTDEIVIEDRSVKFVKKPVARLDDIPYFHDLPFYKKQKRIIMRNCGFIDPYKIEEYISRGGYHALYSAIKELGREKIIEEIKKSGLRGRGGAGFPTGLKWELCRRAEGDIKYIICNADEGDPGAYMDRTLLEGDPHSVIEGMLIGAYAIGASEGYIYVRTEYPLAIEIVENAINQAQDCGLLGNNIFGSDFSFKLDVKGGAGAFVCGEETSLIASIEGKSGEPRQRPPYPAQKGLWDKPTNINNVKTWASIPVIIKRGAQWYSSMGTEKSRGTTIFSLVGRINNAGLVEVPLGIKLKEMIYDIGGGIPGGKKFKAVQTGGPSGGCIPVSLIDTAVDYEHLSEVGSMMGSGGMIVMDEDSCMVDIAKFFITFTQSESCGKCTPCREGTKRMLEILIEITKGNADMEDLKLLEDLAHYVKETSLCGLGGTAPNPVLSTIKYFRDEYILHIEDKKCPAKVCKNLISFRVNPEKCNGCGVCITVCSVKAITGEKKAPHRIDPKICSKCDACFKICKFEAIIKEDKVAAG